MYILAINTATSTSGVAILEEDKIAFNLLNSRSWNALNSEAEHIMPSISEMVDEIDIDFSDINRVVCVNGPGSFTGLRIGVNVANTISHLNKCDLFSVNTFAYLWDGKPAKANNKKAAALLFAGKGAVYVSLDSNAEQDVVDLDNLEQYLNDRNIEVVFGDIIDSQKPFIGNILFIDFNHNFGPIIKNTIEKSFKNHLCCGVVENNLKSTSLIMPNYIKTASITKSKKNILQQK